jgi:hypothetical protein
MAIPAKIRGAQGGALFRKLMVIQARKLEAQEEEDLYTKPRPLTPAATKLVDLLGLAFTIPMRVTRLVVLLLGVAFTIPMRTPATNV